MITIRKIILSFLILFFTFTLVSCQGKVLIVDLYVKEKVYEVSPKDKIINPDVVNKARESFVTVEFRSNNLPIVNEVFLTPITSSAGLIVNKTQTPTHVTYYCLTINSGFTSYDNDFSKFKNNKLELTQMPYDYFVFINSTTAFKCKTLYSLNTSDTASLFGSNLVKTSYKTLSSAMDFFVLTFTVDLATANNINLQPALLNDTPLSSYSSLSSYDVFAFESYNFNLELDKILRNATIASVNEERPYYSLLRNQAYPNVGSSYSLTSKGFELDINLNIYNMGTAIFDNTGKVIGIFISKDLIGDLTPEGPSKVGPTENLSRAICVSNLSIILGGILNAN